MNSLSIILSIDHRSEEAKEGPGREPLTRTGVGVGPRVPIRLVVEESPVVVRIRPARHRTSGQT